MFISRSLRWSGQFLKSHFSEPTLSRNDVQRVDSLTLCSTVFSEHGMTPQSYPLKRSRNQAENVYWSQMHPMTNLNEVSHPSILNNTAPSLFMQSRNHDESQCFAAYSDHMDTMTENKASFATLDGNLAHARKKPRNVTMMDLKKEDSFDEQSDMSYASSYSQTDESQVSSEDLQTKRTNKNIKKKKPSAHSDVDGIIDWGWKDRVNTFQVPTFGDTREIIPLFDAVGGHVKATLSGLFEFSRHHKGRVSDDGGPLVHELQKRNIFTIADMAYRLDMPSWVSTYPILRLHQNLYQIHGMFVKLVGRSCGSKKGIEAPLESRGLSRATLAVTINVINELRPLMSEDSAIDSRPFSPDPHHPLPDSFSATHLEFKHATVGNKTKGFWRVETQDYYRLVLQLCANIGDPDNLIVVAETETDPVLVRGRPPGGRTQNKAKSSKAKLHNPKAANKKGKKPSPIKLDLQDEPCKEEDEDDWMNTPTMQSVEEKTPRNSDWSFGRNENAGGYGTHDTFSNPYYEQQGEFDDGESDIFGDENEDREKQGSYESSVDIESEVSFETDVGPGLENVTHLGRSNIRQAHGGYQGNNESSKRGSANVQKATTSHANALNPGFAPYKTNDRPFDLPNGVRRPLP